MNDSTSKAATGGTLRLLWPQWQGAGSEVVGELFGEVPLDVARRGYTMGTRVIDLLLGRHDGPTAVVPVPMGQSGLEIRDGIEAKDSVLAQLRSAVEILEECRPNRVVTVGGDCAVSVVPFTYLAAQHPGDVAVIWIDAHPDVDTPESAYPGYHAMAVSAITGHGDAEILAELPTVIPAQHVALVGLHAWTEDVIENVDAWGLTSFAPDVLHRRSTRLLDWLRVTGCSRVVIHLDVDVVDSDEIVLGLGAEPEGLTMTDVRRIISDVAAEADVVGLTIAEYIPRQVIRLQGLLDGLPLL